MGRRMISRISIRTVFLLLFTGLLVSSANVDAAKNGRSHLVIRQVGTGATDVDIQVGQILNVELWIEGDGEQITGSSVFLSFDDTDIELVPAGFVGGGNLPIPFTKGTYIRGVIFDNRTINDLRGNSLANGLPLFQLHYFENIQSNAFGSANPAIGNGQLASFQLRILRKPANGQVSIRVD